MYITKDYTKFAELFMFSTVFYAHSRNNALCLKNYHKIEKFSGIFINQNTFIILVLELDKNIYSK